MWPRIPPNTPQSPVRWWPLGPICVVGSVLLYVVQVEGWSVIRPSRDFTIVVGLINFFVYVWVRAWSRMRTATQVTAIGLLLASQTAMLAVLRLEGFAGDGRVLFKWRWAPTPEERLADFSLKAEERASLANLAETSEMDSPAFRGADRTGRCQFRELDLNWKDHPPREQWRHPVGRGWSSFAVVGEFCITQEQRDNFEAVVCYRLETGGEVWRHLDTARFEEVTSGPGPRATPTIDAGRVYTLGATGILNCLDGANGQLVWSRKIAKNTAPVLFGFVSSPLVHGRHVYVTPGGKSGAIVAVDRDTGEIEWSRGSSNAIYSSPQLFVTGSDAQVLVFGATGLSGHDAETGDTRWSFLWGDNSDERVNVGQPVIVDLPAGSNQDGIESHQLLISSGYGRGSALILVVRNSSDAWTATGVWRARTLKSKFSAVVVHDRHAYGLDDGILTCISLADGSRRWKQGRYGYGQLILVNDTLLIQAELGRIVLVEANPNAFSEVATLDALSERTWNHPVVAGRHLIVRNDREAVCYLLPISTPK